MKALQLLTASYVLALMAGVASAEDAAQAPIEATPYFAAISVADVDASADWYRRVFGLEVVRRTDLSERGIRIRLLRSEHAFLELVENAEARAAAEIDPAFEKPYLVHGPFKLGFLVDQLEVTVERLKGLGVPLRGRVVTEADGSLRSVQIEDPDGNILQLFERLA